MFTCVCLSVRCLHLVSCKAESSSPSSSVASCGYLEYRQATLSEMPMPNCAEQHLAASRFHKRKAGLRSQQTHTKTQGSFLYTLFECSSGK